MRRPSDPRLAALALIATCASCGAFSSITMEPSRGDVDLPTSLLGPFRALDTMEAPSGSRVLVQASGESVDEPSIVEIAGIRVAYYTARSRTMPDRIGRAASRGPAPPRGLTGFEFGSAIFSAELPWENGAVSSPSVVVATPTEIHMAYAAGGAIGLATSSDGRAFVRRPAPALTADTSRGESAVIEAPSLARAPTGEWFMAYASGGRVFLARAPRPEGPWDRVDGDATSPGRDPVLSPASAVAEDAGTAFEMRAVGDPALSIQELPSGRTMFRLFYTATGPELLASGQPRTVVGASASFDPGCAMSSTQRPCFARVAQPAYSERTNAVRAGSFELVDDHTALLWVSTTSGSQRVVTAAVAPVPTMLAMPGAL